MRGNGETMVEILAYEKMGGIGELELRKYPKTVVLTTPRTSDYTAHMILYGYITGRNRSNARFAMTAPVLSDADRMCFVLPRKYARDDLPKPLDAEIAIREIPERVVAVLGFTGHADEPVTAHVTSRLLSALAEAGIRTVGKPFLMRYDPPTIVDSRRRNEVAIEVEAGGW
jgi:hypothetical protein